MNKPGFIVSILIFLLSFRISANDPPVFTYILEDDIPAISLYISQNDINGIYGSDSISLLVYSIQAGSNKVVEFLLQKGADPDQSINGKTPLMYAISEGSRNKINTLLKYNAEINLRDPEGNHSLIYAAMNGDVGIIKILLKHGAFLNLQNYEYLDAYDFAVKSNKPEAAKYLKYRFEKNLPEITDGPHVFWNKNRSIQAFYLYHDSIQNISKKITRSYKSSSDSFRMEGFFRDPNSYLLFKESDNQPSEFKSSGKIMVIGDIHGGYDSLKKLLIRNHIIDLQLNWIWGDGHLVFLGDIFDRGDKVTESLWLIYKLDQQAGLSNGMVHLLLGNHEVLVLLKNQLYINDKYYYLCKKLRLSYGSLFDKNTVLGKWLRSKNAVVKIDDKLFVHAGISPEIVQMNYSIDQINEMVRYYINHPERHRKFGLGTKDLIMGEKGPFWYRGYLEDNYRYKRVSIKQINEILDYYEVSEIFAGHTNVDAIKGYFNNQVFLMDVPFYSYTHSIRALLIENNGLFLISSDGTKTRF